MIRDLSTRESVKVAILSDTHSYLCPQVLAVVSGCDAAVHAGDIGGKEVLDQLRAAAGEVIAVAGNNDISTLWAADEAHEVNSLPQVTRLLLPNGRLTVEHGHVHGLVSPDHARLRAAHPDTRMIVYGHTHKLVIDRAENPWVVNPGAAGLTRNHGGPSCLVLQASLHAWDIETFRFPDS